MASARTTSPRLARSPRRISTASLGLGAGSKRQGGSSDGFVVEGLAQGSLLSYHVQRIPVQPLNVTLRLANGGSCSGGWVELRKGGDRIGPVLAKCSVGRAGGAWNMFVQVPCDAALTAGAVGATEAELALTFAGCAAADAFVRLDAIVFGP